MVTLLHLEFLGISRDSATWEFRCYEIHLYQDAVCESFNLCFCLIAFSKDENNMLL